VTRPYSYRSDPRVPAFQDDKPVVIFDGFCALCSASARFILRFDRRAAFRLLPAQTDLGRALYRHYGLDPEDYQSFILVADGTALFKSEAAIRIATRLGPPWSLARMARVLPLALRDRLYDFVARNRFRIMSRRAVCYAPEARYRDRFLG
jgi:predicted DCC family thiol-disulfide oxidoreductase YuxK